MPEYKSLKIGTKVLCRLEIEDEPIALLNNDNKNGIYGSHAKWMAVVIKKLKDGFVKILFSINSYESDLRKRTNTRNRPFSTSNLDKIVHVSQLVLLKKAPLCV